MLKQVVGELERRFETRAAYDKRPRYGQHCADLCFYVVGPAGAVQLLIYSGWYPGLIATPDKTWQEWSHCKRNAYADGSLSEPMAADLGYHSPVPRHDDQLQMQEVCPVLDGRPCYYDGSALNGGRLLSLLIHEGDEAMWKALEDYYHRTFDTEPVNLVAPQPD